jgi:hypothetical protein
MLQEPHLIKVTVFDMPIRRLSGVGKTSGKPYDMAVQTIYFHTQDASGQPLPVPEKSELVLDKDQVPFPPGDYTLSPASLYVNRDGKLAVAPKLVALKRAA